MDPVVQPPPAQHPVLGRPDEGVLGAVERRPPVGHRHEVDVPALPDGHELDADLARGVVEPEPAGLPQLAGRATQIKQRFNHKLVEHHAYVREHGEDLPEVRNWVWQGAAAAPTDAPE